MKFKITKGAADSLMSTFKKTDSMVQEIELEPVHQTATEAMAFQEAKNEAFMKGLEQGYQNGYHDGEMEAHRRERDIRMGFYTKRPSVPCLKCTYGRCSNCGRTCL